MGICVLCFIKLKKKVKAYDDNKLYTAELLSILVQNEDENRKLLGELNGIDSLLQQIAVISKTKTLKLKHQLMVDFILKVLQETKTFIG